jgi:uncharacterized membrane protein
VAVIAMVMAHVTESWTREPDRSSDAFYALAFIAGVASPLFVFLAGVATALSAASKGRRQGSHHAGALLARRRGWEIFALGLVFRVQSQLLGLGPLNNLFKVDILNTMGLAMVAASYVWQLSGQRRPRLALLAAATISVTMLTPIVRQLSWLSALPDQLEAYLRPAGGLAAFPLFPWAAFLFAGVIVGDLIDAVRDEPGRVALLQRGIALCSSAGILLGWAASYLPPLYKSASFWHDSPTFFFIRLGLCGLLVGVAWSIERVVDSSWLQPVVVLGRSSLFVYWIHVEMVYGVIAEPIKRQLPLWATLAATALLCVMLYVIVRLKNRWLERYELRGGWRLLAAVIR